MARLENRVDVSAASFRENDAHNRALAADLRARQQAVRHERPQRDIDRLARQKKMLVRDRLTALLDPGTPFLELSTLAANQAYDGDAPGAGQVSGIGIVAAHEVIVHGDDASVKGGAWYPLSVKKIVRTLDIAIENRLPVVHLCDSAGGFFAVAGGAVSGPDARRADFPQSKHSIKNGGAAGGGGAGALYRRGRVYSCVVRL
ncbi:MAG: carboxyl transferase domain-containing protein [Rhodospirillales bacterium]